MSLHITYFAPRSISILVKYPVAQAYQAYISEIENNPKLKNKLSAIKDTEAFKELESFVSEFTGA